MSETITLPPMPALPEQMPPVAPQGKKPRKWLKPAAIAAGGVVVLIIGLSIGSAGRSGVDAAAPAEAKPAAEAPVTEAPAADEPEAEAPIAEPVKAEGSLDNPYPLGYVASIYEGSVDNTVSTVSVAIKDANANVAIAQANQFNDAAAPGSHYVAVEYTVTGKSSTEPTSVSYMLYDWSLATADGTLIPETNTTVVYPDAWNDTYDVADLYEGQTAAAVVIYQVPDSYTGPLYATGLGKYLSL